MEKRQKIRELPPAGADRAESGLPAGWAQALRTPLNAVLGHAQILLMNDALDPEARQQVEEIVRGGEQMACLIGDMLEQADAAPALEAKRNDARRRILVAEDSPANQAVLRMQLEALGCEADIAADGAAGLAKWKTGGHDLILADRNMPGMDGLSLARAIRAAEREGGRRVPIIAITAANCLEALDACREAGMDDMLCKPIQLDELKRMLARWLPLLPVPPADAAPKPAAPLDIACLARIVNGVNSEQVRELVDMFIATAHADLPACRQLIEERDGRGLALAMHKLKSPARSVGALRFAQLAEALENIARDGRLEAAAALLAELDHAVSDIEAAARQFAVPPGQHGGQAVGPNEIMEGIRRDEFEVHFQPKVDAATLRVVGVEALARWQRDGRPVPPDVFIGAAERHGLIGPLSELLITKAVIGGTRLAEAGFPLNVAVNLSASWLTDVHLPEFILASLQATAFRAENLTLEIGEAGAMADLATALDVMTRLRLKGVKLSIADFGTGYSSMAQLQRIPLGELKLDRGYVRDAATKQAARVILGASIEMALKLNLTTVAEGVETQADLDMVRGLGCDQVQGWLIAKAMPLEALIEWLRAWPVSGAKPA